MGGETTKIDGNAKIGEFSSAKNRYKRTWGKTQHRCLVYRARTTKATQQESSPRTPPSPATGALFDPDSSMISWRDLLPVYMLLVSVVWTQVTRWAVAKLKGRIKHTGGNRI
jgi:hypothetical protein